MNDTITQWQEFTKKAREDCVAARMSEVDRIVDGRLKGLEAVGGKALQNKSELKAVAAEMHRRKGVKGFVDIGGAYGGTLYTLAPFVRKGTLLTVVFLRSRKYAGERHDKMQATLRRVVKALRAEGHRIEYMEANSQRPGTAVRIAELYGVQRPEVVYIDADHRYPGTVSDYAMYRSVIAKGGLMFFHDIVTESGPRTLFWTLRNWYAPEKTAAWMGPGARPTGTGVLYF